MKRPPYSATCEPEHNAYVYIFTNWAAAREYNANVHPACLVLPDVPAPDCYDWSVCKGKLVHVYAELEAERRALLVGALRRDGALLVKVFA